MKNIIIGLLAGLIIGWPISVYAKAVMNPIKCVGRTIEGGHLYTTKISTNDGTYRLFIYEGYKAGGLTAVKIK